MAAMLETPSRVWRRIQDIEGQEMPSLPSIPAMEDLTEMHSETTDDLDASRMSNPITSTPAAFSSYHNTVSTIKPPLTLGTGSTARFANSIESRPSKSAIGTSASGSKSGVSKQQPVQQQPQQYSFDISMIPSLPQPHDDVEIRSSDQDTHDSIADAYFPPTDTGAEEDFNISEALQSVSRSESPIEPIAPTPRKSYDYSVSLRSEPKVSLFCSSRIARVRTVFSSLLPSTNCVTSLYDVPYPVIRAHPVSRAPTRPHHHPPLRILHPAILSPCHPIPRHLFLRYLFHCHARILRPQRLHDRPPYQPCPLASFHYHLPRIHHL